MPRDDVKFLELAQAYKIYCHSKATGLQKFYYEKKNVFKWFGL